MFATSLNLLPGGQLDGGHIVFALAPRVHRWATIMTALILLPLAWYGWAGWAIWAVLVLLTGTRHPIVPQHPPLTRKRRMLALLALGILIVTFMPAPLLHQSIPEAFRR
jgi:membrane-associated protease RseP (regulator of RpoE activity)